LRDARRLDPLQEDTPVTALELFEDIAFGFRLTQSPRASRMAEAWMPMQVRAATSPATHASSLDPLGARIAELVDSETALELTGGSDCRLLLSLILAFGTPIERAFTLDLGDGDDAMVARAIAEALGLEHLVVRPTITSTRVLEDAILFTRSSGWSCNAVSYGWMPGVYRQLAGFRKSQIGGVGGEIATGFFRTPLDRFAFCPCFVGSWRRFRLQRPAAWLHLFRPEVRHHLAALSAASVDAFFSGNRNRDAWRDRSDAFYLERRIRHWAAPVLTASSRWYEPRMPFLTDEYLQWARSVPPKERSRGRQHRVTAEYLARASASGFLDARGHAALFTRPNPTRSGKLRRAMARLMAKPRPAPMVYREFAAALAGDERLRHAIMALAERGGPHDLGLDRAAVERLLAAPQAACFEFGAVATAACSRLDPTRA
jgi:hypothetical protein